MEIKKAKIENIEIITNIVQTTIKHIYPKYYPKDVVDFFVNHHTVENIRKDIVAGQSWLVLEGNEYVGTGSFEGQHIIRVFILPEFQHKGYGSYIMDFIERQIRKEYDKAYLDASLAAITLYIKRGYRTIEHRQLNVDNDCVLVYEIMEKVLSTISDESTSYNGLS